MVYLHENREEFTNAVNLASEYFHILPIIAEKDYYVTMILRELSERQDFIVFKGGTSLSKCHKAIKRFSEDIDITIDSKLTQGQMKKLTAYCFSQLNQGTYLIRLNTQIQYTALRKKGFMLSLSHQEF